MAWRVVVAFEDIQDNLYHYGVGDSFPRAGVKVKADRIKALATNKNRRGIPLIEEVEKPKKDD